MALGSFTGMGFQITTDISSKTELVVFLFKVSFKRKHKDVWKGWFLGETNNKVTKITYKEKYFLKFLDYWAQVPYIKRELWSLALPKAHKTMISGLRGENRDLNKKYLKKKSNRVGRKYLGLHRWISQVETWLAKISQVEIVHFASWTLISQVEFVISQLAKLSFSLVWLSSNGHNFFISASIHTPFEALDSWLPKIRNDI